ncbi:unnamed protein product [Callosobruchus maculatus]|uniref:Reverse transcriptase domain-containing protein n=1 Tax=Callosobruchus maculatus TaxID=64391 RepID=A0A653BHU4_CALMS|nr:unnamed protein product [Callosobruchus maculatus]
MLLNFLSNKDVIIVGDFNIPSFVLDESEPKLNILKNFIEVSDLKQYNNVKNTNGRLLDLVLSNITCQAQRDSSSLVKEDRHHPSLILQFSVTAQKSYNFRSNRDHRMFNFRKANFPLMYHLVSQMSWHNVIECTDVNDAVQQLERNLKNIFELSVPYKISSPRKYPPWFSRNTIKELKQKELAHRLYKKHKTDDYYDRFHNLRSSVKRKINDDYYNFLNHAENSISSDPTQFWNFIRNKKGNSRIPGVMRMEGSVFENEQDIVDAFGRYFSSVYNIPNVTLADDLPQKYFNQPAITITTITEADVINSSKKLKNKLIIGPDQIPSFLIKDCIFPLLQPLLYIYNLILKTNTFPQAWKLAKITPVLKKGDPSQISNYRPISVLCNFAKLFEMIIYWCIYSATKETLSTDQHGFIDKKSCVTNLACLTQTICENLDDRGQVDVVYMDMQKAFDRIDLGVLLKKLGFFGFTDDLLSLFKSYLFDRNQYVEFEGYRSSLITPTSGIPQGSNLGPLLFLLYINDLTLDVKCSKLLYADDLKIYCSVVTNDDCLALQQDIDAISAWSLSNHLELNPDKCSVVSYTKKNNPITFPYHMNHTILSRQEQIRDLGILFDQKMSFAPHIESTVSSANRMLGFVIRNGRQFSISVLKLLYTSYVRSKLEYGVLIWYPYYVTHISQIERVQRKFLKYLYFKKFGVFPERGFDYSILLNEAKIISLNKRRIYLASAFCINCYTAI